MIYLVVRIGNLYYRYMGARVLKLSIKGFIIKYIL